jgi:hypothetical protein
MIGRHKDISVATAHVKPLTVTAVGSNYRRLFPVWHCGIRGHCRCHNHGSDKQHIQIFHLYALHGSKLQKKTHRTNIIFTSLPSPPKIRLNIPPLTHQLTAIQQFKPNLLTAEGYSFF